VPGRMVTEAENVTAAEALDAGAIDLVAGSEHELLGELDGFRVQGPKETVLDTAGLEIDERQMPFQYELLALLVNPTIAYLLLLLGLVGIAIEIFSPGLIVPGLVGAVSFLLGAFGSAQLPVTAAGIALLVVGLALIVAESQLPTHGLLGVVGVIALAVSGLLLFDTGSDAFEVSAPVVIVVALLIGGGLAFAIKKAADARGQPVRAGPEQLVGTSGEVRQPLSPIGQIYVAGALWRATVADDVAPADADRVRERGAKVRVEAVEGLTLRVRPLAEVEATEQGAGT
jgi:membrane-bound serine protease (ClpP class)